MARDPTTGGGSAAALRRREQSAARAHVRARQAAAPAVPEIHDPPPRPVPKVERSREIAQARAYVRARQQAPVVRGEDAADKARAPSSPRVRFEQRRNALIEAQYGTGRAGGNQQASLVSSVLGPLAEGAAWAVTHPRERLAGEIPERFASRDPATGFQMSTGEFPWGPTGRFFRFRRAAREPGVREPAPPTPEPELPPTAEERIGGSLEEARRAQQQQAAVTSAERGRRINAASDAYARAGGGEAGRRAALSELSGEIPKVKFGALKDITEDEIDRINDYIRNHPDFEGYRWVQGQAAVARVLNGQVPRKFEIKLLDELFGPEKVAEIAKDADLAARLRGFAGNLWNLPRAAKSSLDVSGGLRQGGLVAASHPRIWAGAWGPSMRATKYLTPAQREVAGARAAEKLMQRPNAERYKTGKVALAGVLGPREEAYASGFSDLIPGIGHSAQQYTTFLNTLRADFFDHLMKVGRKAGHDIDDPEFLKATGKIVNEMTGRGTFEGYEGAVKLLSGLFFSPRLMASRVKFLGRAFNPYTLTGGRGPKANPAKRLARREARRAMATFIVPTMGILAIMDKMPGVEVGTNPTSADFGKIKVGDTRVDIWAGFQSYVVLAGRLATGTKTLSTTGESEDVEKYGFGRVTGSLLNFFENKFAPQISYLWQWDEAGEATGREFDPLPELGKLFLPIGVENAGETLRDYSPARTAAEFGAGFVGFGAQTYGAGELDLPPTAREKVTAALTEERKVARDLGVPLPPQVAEALRLQTRLRNAVDSLEREQRKREDVVTPKDKRFKLTARQKAAAELAVIGRVVPEHDARLKQILASLKTERQIDQFRDQLKNELGLGVLEQWHRETAEALEERALAAAG